MTPLIVQVSHGGRIVIPAEVRKKMNIAIGDQVLLSWSEETHELHIATRKQRLQNALDLVQRYARKGKVVDELIHERRQEAKHE